MSLRTMYLAESWDIIIILLDFEIFVKYELYDHD